MAGKGRIPAAEAAGADFLPEDGGGVAALSPPVAQIRLVRRQQGRPPRARLTLREAISMSEPAHRLPRQVQPASNLTQADALRLEAPHRLIPCHPLGATVLLLPFRP